MDEQDATELPLSEPTPPVQGAAVNPAYQAKSAQPGKKILQGPKQPTPPTLAPRQQLPLRTAGVPRGPRHPPPSIAPPLPKPEAPPPWMDLLKELEASRDEQLLALIKLADPAELMSVINLSPSSSPLRGRIFSLAFHLIPVCATAPAVEEIRLLWNGLRQADEGQPECP